MNIFLKHILYFIIVCIALPARAQQKNEHTIYMSEPIKAEGHAASLLRNAYFQLFVDKLSPSDYHLRIYVTEPNVENSSYSGKPVNGIVYFIKNKKHSEWYNLEKMSDEKTDYFQITHSFKPDKNLEIQVLIIYPGKQGTGVVTFRPFKD